MKSTFISLLCTVVTFSDSSGTRRYANASQLENISLYGKNASQDEPTYIASLQLDSVHICSSGLFREGFLLTTGSCAYHILCGMTRKRQTGTALLGDSDLNKGQRAVILDISYSKKMKVDKYDLGLVLLADTVDYTHIEILPLFTRQINLRLLGSEAQVCGWGIVSQDNALENAAGDTQYPHNLRCTDLRLLVADHCTKTLHLSDFRRKLICAEALQTDEKTTWGDVGSPLIQTMEGFHGCKKYISGVTVSQAQSEKGIIFNFVRMNYGLPYIKKMISKLQCHGESYTDNIGSNSSENDSSNKPSKRPKVRRTHVKRTIFAGKELLTLGSHFMKIDK